MADIGVDVPDGVVTNFVNAVNLAFEEVK